MSQSKDEHPEEPEQGDQTTPDTEDTKTKRKLSPYLIAGAVVGGGAAIVAAPFAISALGFTSAGIAAGSWAASWMSAAAIANGGGIAAGSTVAILQGIGAAGMGAGSTAVAGAVGATIGGAVAGIGAFFTGKKSKSFSLTINKALLVVIQKFKEGLLKDDCDWLALIIKVKENGEKDLLIAAKATGNIDNIHKYLPKDLVMFVLYRVTDRQQDKGERKETGHGEKKAEETRSDKEKSEPDEKEKSEKEDTEKEIPENARVLDGMLKTLSNGKLVLVTSIGTDVNKDVVTQEDIDTAKKALGEFDISMLM